MPGFNLVRNSRVFFTTNVNASTGVVADGALTTLGATTPGLGTQEIAVMNGFSFSQNTDSQTITVSEAGNIPTRGQRAFNTALQPVEFSFSTYIRPRGLTTSIDMDEKVLWNALLSDGLCNLAPTGIANAGHLAAPMTTIARTGNSNVVTYTLTASTNISAVPGFAIGDRLNVGGVVNDGGVGVNALGFNGSGTLTSIVGTLAACTGMVVTMDIAPSGSGNPSTPSGTVFFSKTSALLRNLLTTNEPAHVQATAGLSNKNQLQKFGICVIIDQATYVIDNCALDQAVIDFGLDGIAMVQWTGKGTKLRTLAATTVAGTVLSTGLVGNFTAATGPSVSAGNFITKKLSTATLASTFRGQGTGAVTYTVALTGGSVTIANNITYVTPEVLGVVNEPIGYFTGTRAISGNITAYLKTGSATTTAGLLSALLAATSETKYYLELHLGGINNAVKVELEFPAVTLQVPTIDVQDVVSTSIQFVSQGAVLPSSLAADLVNATTSYYDLEATNDLLVRYYSV